MRLKGWDARSFFNEGLINALILALFRLQPFSRLTSP